VSALKPGLYRATVRGVADQIVMLTDAPTEDPWVSMLTSTGTVRWRWHEGGRVTDARPLIVLDLEHPAETVRHLRAESSPWDCIEEIAAAIEAQTKPARIPEPGLWGVVEATGNRWIRYSLAGYDDWANMLGRQAVWADLIYPTLIRAGVES